VITAAALLAASRAGHGILTQKDLDGYQTRELAPGRMRLRGFHVVAAPPPSSGGIALCEILNVLEGYPLGAYGFGSAPAIHSRSRRCAMRTSIATTCWAIRRRAAIRSNYCSTGNTRSGSAPASNPAHAGNSGLLKPASPRPRAAIRLTTRSPIASATPVAVTYTLNDWFGARVTAPGTGVLLNDEMDDFTSKVGVANMYGLVQGVANKIEPGKRPLSSMTPTIVSRDASRG